MCVCVRACTVMRCDDLQPVQGLFLLYSKIFYFLSIGRKIMLNRDGKYEMEKPL